MSVQKLPIELLDGICQHILTTDLVALSQTCSFIYPVTQRLLYRHVSVSPLSDNLSVVTTLAKKPEIALFVRSFSVNIDSYSTLFHTFYHQLSVAISNMSDMTSLEVFVDSSASWVLNGARDAAFPRLQRFSCSFPFDTQVAEFLTKTCALLELEVDSIPTLHTTPLPPFSRSSIPRLTRFIGSSHAAKAIVPGRPVENIHLSSGDLMESTVNSIAQSTARVVVLDATTGFLPVPLLELLAQRLPHLAYLRIMTTYNFAEAPNVVFYEDVAKALAALPDLTTFELSGMHWGSRKKSDDEKRVWQSKPLSSEFFQNQADTFLDFDFSPNDFLT